jgi:signal peptidase I
MLTGMVLLCDRRDRPDPWVGRSAGAAPGPGRPLTSVPDVRTGDADGAATGAAAPIAKTRSRGKGIVEWVVVIIVALIIAALLKTFVVEAFKIPSGSMEPTIQINDRVLVDKLSYKLGGQAQAGNVVVFDRPPTFFDAEDPNVTDLIKRVIGTPGEALETGPGGEILVNGRPLSQPWLSAASKANPGPAICTENRTDCIGATLHLPADEYLVMGDNRDNSYDGRYFGPISGHLFIGRAFVRVWPLSRFHWF